MNIKDYNFVINWMNFIRFVQFYLFSTSEKPGWFGRPYIDCPFYSFRIREY